MFLAKKIEVVKNTLEKIIGHYRRTHKYESLICINPTSENSEGVWWVWLCDCEEFWIMNHKADEKCPKCGRFRPTN